MLAEWKHYKLTSIMKERKKWDVKFNTKVALYLACKDKTSSSFILGSKQQRWTEIWQHLELKQSSQYADGRFRNLSMSFHQHTQHIIIPNILTSQIVLFFTRKKCYITKNQYGSHTFFFNKISAKSICLKDTSHYFATIFF